MRLLDEAPQTTNNFPYWIFIIIGVVLLVTLIVGGFLFYKFVIVRSKMKKEIRELDRRFNYLHSFLIGQVAQNIRRIEVISRSNLLYVDTHTRYLKKFKDIRDKKDSHTQTTIIQLKELVEEKKYSQLKEAIAEAKIILASYEKDVNTLSSDLVAVIKPEEDARQNALTLKEDLRRIKQDFYSKESELDLVRNSIELIFNRVEELFNSFDSYIECAQYEDANVVLNEISPLLKQTSQALTKLPKLCVMVNNLVPEKIAHLTNAYELMNEERYPLGELNVPYEIKNMETELRVYVSRIKQFNLRGVEESLNKMIKKIDDIESKFEDEKASRVEFEQNNDAIYHEVTIVERRYVKLANNVPELETVYVINDEHKEKLEKIHQDVDSLGALKRSLNIAVHSVNKSPYSFLVGKMNELKNATDLVRNDLDTFHKYLLSLKDDSQSAYNLIHDVYKEVKDAEKILREINIENISNKYVDKINRTYELFDEIKNRLFAKPINVEEINVLAQELSEISEMLYSENGKISQEFKMMNLAKNAILYANRGRNDFADIAQILEQADILYLNGQFEQSYHLSGDALRKIQAHMSPNERL